MPARQLLPGYAGSITVTISALDASPAASSDTIDCSNVCTLTYQLKEWSEGGAVSVQPKQSFDGVNWANLGSPLTALHERVKLNITDAPFGLLRFDATFDDSDSPASDSSSSSSWGGPFASDIVIEVIGWGLKLSN
jgi:hypothetical protein